MTQGSHRHIVVTGGSRGIGFATASAFAKAGHRVSVIARNPERLKTAVETLRKISGAGAFGHTADVSQEGEIGAALEECRRANGPVECLVNNAGIAESSPFGKTSIEDWNRIISTDLTGVFLCCKAVVDEMISRKYGRIVNVASTAGLKGYSYVAAYCAAKHGVVGLTKALSQELAHHNITVNCVCPGFTQTDILSSTVENAAKKTGRSSDTIKTELLKSTPSGKFTTPEEVAAAIVWLCDDLQSSVNGAAIPICGGEIA